MAAAAAPDLISNQPDAVLETIVSLLPTKDGCRTQALSRRWRHIWRSAPLNLAAGRGSGGKLPEQYVSEILSNHIGPVRRISITGISPLSCRTKREVVDESGDARVHGWLGSPDVFAGLEVLNIGYRYYGEVLPPSVFRRAPVLRVASFGRCRLPSNLAVNFPSLERLTLYNVSLTEEALLAVLSGCPALRSLLLQKIMASECLRVSSPTLRSIGFCYSPCNNGKELVMEDVPSLERLLLLNDSPGGSLLPPGITVRVVDAPKLKILGCISRDISQLHLGKTVFGAVQANNYRTTEMIAVSLTTTMPTVKVLALDYDGPDLDAVLDFLRCFCCVETLYITFNPWDYRSLKYMKNMRKYALPDDPIECLELHLKKVALKLYYGMGVEVEFARFFVLNAKVMEKMEFGLVDDHRDDWGVNQNTLLQLEDRASRDARFEFKRLTSKTSKNNSKRAHDLSMADPLGPSFWDGYVTLFQV